MTTMNLHAVIDENGRLRLDIPTNLPAGAVELDLTVRHVTPRAEEPVASASPAWIELVGKLQWQGDAVGQQRRLRDEWPD